MDALVAQAIRYIALGMEAGSATLIAAGGIQALFRVFSAPFRTRRPAQAKKDVWLHFGMWLLLGLEFELAADVVKTAIAPTWSAIGQLGAIAVIRVFLNYFLTRDMERYETESAPAAAARARL